MLNGKPLFGELDFAPKATTAGVFVPLETVIIATSVALYAGVIGGQKIAEKAYVKSGNGPSIASMKQNGEVKSILGIVKAQ